MLIFIDFGTLAVLFAVVLAVLGGTSMMAAEWLMSHWLTVLIVLFLKSIVLISALKRERGDFDILAIPLDILRSGGIFLMLLDGVRQAFSGAGLLGLITTGFDLLVGGGLIIAAAEWPIGAFGESSPILAEVVSICLLGLCAILIYVVFGGW